MKNLLLLCAGLMALSLYAKAEDKAKAPSTKESHVQMHEDMAKAHQKAADCLKSGKPEEECRNEFMNEAKTHGGADHCGDGMMKRHRK